MTMTRRACNLEARLKVVTEELKESNEIQKRLLQERDDSEVEMLAILQQNNSLKKQLAELHTQYEDNRNEMECLQSRLESVNQCHETYELAMQKIQDLKQELYECSLKNEHYESLQRSTLNTYNSLDLQTELMDSDSDMTLVDLTTPKCKSAFNLIKGSNKIKKYVKLSNFIKKSEKKLKKHKTVFAQAKLCKEKCKLSAELNFCYKLLEQNSLEQDAMSEKIKALEKSLQDITSKYTKAEQDFSEMADLLHEKSMYVQVRTGCTQTDSTLLEPIPCGTDSVASSHVATSVQVEPPVSRTGLPFAECAAVQPVTDATQSPVTQLTTCQKTRKTVLYSDKVGIGMGRLLSDQLGQVVTNNCLPNAPITRFINNIDNDTSFDIDTTLIVQLGESCGVKHLQLIKLVEILLGKLELGLGKLILCAFPYSDSLSPQENQHIFKLNLILYNLTCRHNDVLYFDTNNFISNFKLTRGTMYLSRRSKLIIAKLLAFNINDSVINTITQSLDKPTVSSSTNNEGPQVVVEGHIAPHLN